MERLIRCIQIYLLLLLICKVFPSQLPASNASTQDSNLQEHVHYKSSEENLTCNEATVTENEYILLDNGSLLLPQSNLVYSRDSFTVQNGSVVICVTDAEVLTESTESEEINNYSHEFQKCVHIFMDHDEFHLMENGTLYVDVYKIYYEPTDYLLKETGVFICRPNYGEMIANLTNSTVTESPTKFSKTFVDISHIGLGISITSLILHLIVFCCVSSIRNLPGCCLASLSISLLIAYLCFVSSSFVNTTEQCANLGLCVYYFFLTSFFWMNAIAFDVWRSFRVVMKELRISSHQVPWRRFLLYSAYSWLIPAMLVTLAKIADATDILPEEYRPAFGANICWFGHRKALLLFFATPLCLVMVMNGVFFFDSAYVINRATIKASHVDKAVLTRRFFMFMRLALLMGLTWIIGIFAGYINHYILWYIFVILNSLQGLFIFIVFSCSSKVRISFLLKLKGRAGNRQSLSVRTISQASGAL